MQLVDGRGLARLMLLDLAQHRYTKILLLLSAPIAHVRTHTHAYTHTHVFPLIWGPTPGKGRQGKGGEGRKGRGSETS